MTKEEFAAENILNYIRLKREQESLIKRAYEINKKCGPVVAGWATASEMMYFEERFEN